MGQIGTLLPKPPYPLRIQWQNGLQVQTLGVGNQFSTPLPSQVGRVILEVGRGHILPPSECFGLCLLFTAGAVQLHSMAVPQFHQGQENKQEP